MISMVSLGDFSLSESIWSLREQEAFTDVEIVCKDGTVDAHRAMLVTNYSPFKSVFELGRESEVIVAKDFTRDEILNDIKQMYFGRDKKKSLKCFDSIGKPVSTVEIILASKPKPKVPIILPSIPLSVGELPKKDRKRIQKQIKDSESSKKQKRIRQDKDLEDELREFEDNFEDMEKTLSKREGVYSNRYVDVPNDPLVYIQNSRTSEEEQPGCVQCGLIFENPEDQSIHFHKHLSGIVYDVNARVFRCEECTKRKVFSSYQTYEKHLNVVHKLFKCLYCYQTTTNERHACIPSKYSCDVCLKFINDEEEMAVHKKNRHLTINCKFCNKYFTSVEEKERHQETCMKQVNPRSLSVKVNNPRDVQGDSFECIHCDTVTGSVQLLLCHMRIKHFQGKICLICNFLTKRGHRDSYHTWIHIKEEYYRYPCDFCERRFYSNTKKTEHENNVHTGNKPFKCKYCDKGFALTASKATHQRTCDKNSDPTRMIQKRTRRVGGQVNYDNLHVHKQMLDDMVRSEEKIVRSDAPVVNDPKSSSSSKRTLPIPNIKTGDVNSQIMALLGKK